MIDCLLDLVLRPGESDLPPVQVLLTVVASLGTLAGGDAAGEIGGQVVPAEMIRRLLSALSAPRARDADERDEPDKPDDRQPTDPMPWDQAEQDELARWWAEMERRVLAGELVDPDGDRDTCRRDPVDDPGGDVTGTAAMPPQLPDEERPAPSTDAGWWATADRAVEDAGTALLQVEQKLSHAQRLVHTAAEADSADETAWRTGPAGRLTDAEDALAVLLSATDAQRERLAGLLAATGGGGLAERPRIALTDALSGALLSLTDLPGLIRAGTCGRPACRRNAARCTHDLGGRPGLGPPGATDAYRPAAELDRWVRARDRRCRFPGCRRRVPRVGELDHHDPCPTGPTSAENLVGYCTTDHRGKHQAPGWEHRLDPDGTLVVATPTGLVAVTSPPRY